MSELKFWVHYLRRAESLIFDSYTCRPFIANPPNADSSLSKMITSTSVAVTADFVMVIMTKLSPSSEMYTELESSISKTAMSNS